LTRAALAEGFTDVARESQRVFRATMNAMARPGSIATLEASLKAPMPLTSGAATLALALCDFETPIWLDSELSNEATRDYLRFHTGAPFVDARAAAAFAFCAAPSGLPDFSEFSLGSLEYPDRSATLIIQVRSLAADRGWRLTGPGIDDASLLEAEPLPTDFVARRQALRPLFPRGLDFIFVAEARIAALPRTTLIEA
jgi:alpha-D-ribose 1-methylphosphonate 5-triphosphate synthase subunit PhnH